MEALVKDTSARMERSIEAFRKELGKSEGQGGLRKTRRESNSLAHRTTWLRSDLGNILKAVLGERIGTVVHGGK